MKRETLYDVICLKETMNGFAIYPISMKGCVDYQTALEKKTELDKAYDPNFVVIWKNAEKFVIEQN